MKNIVFLDIENTIIVDLVNRQFLEDNCERIKKFLKSADFVCFNTWGWITKNEIDPILIRLMLDRLEVDKEKRMGKLFDVEDVVSRMYRWTYSSMRSSIDRGIFFSYSLIYKEINNTGIWDRVFTKTSREIVFYFKGFDYTKEDLKRIISHKQKCLQHYLKRKTIEKDFQ